MWTSMRTLESSKAASISSKRQNGDGFKFWIAKSRLIAVRAFSPLGMITELEEEMRQQFEEKFKQIQIQFNLVFQELFGGGKATLELMEEMDILEAGILIIAQPPGKKLHSKISFFSFCGLEYISSRSNIAAEGIRYLFIWAKGKRRKRRKTYIYRTKAIYLRIKTK